MSFLRPHDYYHLIQQDNLQKLTQQNDQVRTEAELAAQAEVESYLRYKYDMAKVFPDVTKWTVGSSWDTGELASVEATTQWVSGNTYQSGDLVYHNVDGTEKVFKANTTTSTTTEPQNSGDFDEVGIRNAIYESQTDGNTNFPASADWKQKDPRSRQIKMYLIDVTLYHIHSRLQPRFIPELRIQRRDDAVKWLEKIAKGEITANLPRRAPDSTKDEPVRYGGSLRNTF